MKINADLGQPADIDTNTLEWIPSPIDGVARKMLDRDGAEVARATSLVKFEPGSSFSAHSHGGGEEFLVLEGVFSDEFGDYATGTYVRNPPGSSHSPSSGPGAVIFVKLRQMQERDSQAVRIDTRDERAWIKISNTEEELPLFYGEEGQVAMRRLHAGHSGTVRKYDHGLELFVLRGAIRIADVEYGRGAWIRRQSGAEVSIDCEIGATFYEKQDHLGC